MIAKKEVEKPKAEEVKSTAKIADEIDEMHLNLKRAKSSMPYR